MSLCPRSLVCTEPLRLLSAGHRLCNPHAGGPRSARCGFKELRVPGQVGDSRLHRAPDTTSMPGWEP